MYEETKIAVKKAFEIGKILFSMDLDRYYKLLEATSRIKPPTFEEVSESELPFEESFIKLLKERYVSAALSAGFTERQGLAILEYAALVEEVQSEI